MMAATGANKDSSLESLPLQGEGMGGGYPKGGVTRHAAEQTIRNGKLLRKNLTEVEKKLWYQLRAKRFSDFKFRRQHAVGSYVVDFVCLKSKLIIELDGGQHNERIVHDEKRTSFLESKGFTVLRFWNNEVNENEEAILQVILQTLSPTLSPTLSLKGEGVFEHSSRKAAI